MKLVIAENSSDTQLVTEIIEEKGGKLRFFDGEEYIVACGEDKLLEIIKNQSITKIYIALGKKALGTKALGTKNSFLLVPTTDGLEEVISTDENSIAKWLNEIRYAKSIAENPDYNEMQERCYKELLKNIERLKN